MIEQLEAEDEILSRLEQLEVLYNNEFVTLEEYHTIKNRILDRLIEVHKYYEGQKNPS